MTEYSRVHVGKTVGGESWSLTLRPHGTQLRLAGQHNACCSAVGGNSECEPACVHCLLFRVPPSKLLRRPTSL